MRWPGESWETNSRDRFFCLPAPLRTRFVWGMTRHQLASTLIKVFGFTICVTSLVWLLGTFLSLCYAAYLSGGANGKVDMARYFLGAMPTSHILSFMAGFTCVLQAEQITTKILKLRPEGK